MKGIIRFFDKLEDRVRGRLSRLPIWYALIGGVGIVLFWRGVWHTADVVSSVLSGPSGRYEIISRWQFWDGPVTAAIGITLLLATGLFVSNFIGNEIIISGLRGEKKLAEKTEAEVKTETGAIGEMRRELRNIAERLQNIEKKIK